MSISQEHRYYLKLKALYYLYEEGYTQTEIAKLLNISRVTLSRLLEEAKAEGMIKFEIVDVRGAMKTLQLEEKLRQRFGLQDIKLVDCSGADTDTLTRKIGSEAASYFEQLVHNNMWSWPTIINISYNMQMIYSKSLDQFTQSHNKLFGTFDPDDRIYNRIIIGLLIQNICFLCNQFLNDISKFRRQGFSDFRSGILT